jgi:hypothetical protein
VSDQVRRRVRTAVLATGQLAGLDPWGALADLALPQAYAPVFSPAAWQELELLRGEAEAEAVGSTKP